MKCNVGVHVGHSSIKCLAVEVVSSAYYLHSYETFHYDSLTSTEVYTDWIASSIALFLKNNGINRPNIHMTADLYTFLLEAVGLSKKEFGQSLKYTLLENLGLRDLKSVKTRWITSPSTLKGQEALVTVVPKSVFDEYTDCANVLALESSVLSACRLLSESKKVDVVLDFQRNHITCMLVQKETPIFIRSMRVSEAIEDSVTAAYLKKFKATQYKPTPFVVSEEEVSREPITSAFTENNYTKEDEAEDALFRAARQAAYKSPEELVSESIFNDEDFSIFNRDAKPILFEEETESIFGDSTDSIFGVGATSVLSAVEEEGLFGGPEFTGFSSNEPDAVVLDAVETQLVEPEHVIEVAVESEALVDYSDMRVIAQSDSENTQSDAETKNDSSVQFNFDEIDVFSNSRRELELSPVINEILTFIRNSLFEAQTALATDTLTIDTDIVYYTVDDSCYSELLPMLRDEYENTLTPLIYHDSFVVMQHFVTEATKDDLEDYSSVIGLVTMMSDKDALTPLKFKQFDKSYARILAGLNVSLLAAMLVLGSLLTVYTFMYNGALDKATTQYSTVQSLANQKSMEYQELQIKYRQDFDVDKLLADLDVYNKYNVGVLRDIRYSVVNTVKLTDIAILNNLKVTGLADEYADIGYFVHNLSEKYETVLADVHTVGEGDTTQYEFVLFANLSRADYDFALLKDIQTADGVVFDMDYESSDTVIGSSQSGDSGYTPAAGGELVPTTPTPTETSTAVDPAVPPNSNGGTAPTIP